MESLIQALDEGADRLQNRVPRTLYPRSSLTELPFNPAIPLAGVFPKTT